MTSNNDKLRKILLKYVGDNVGEDCDCTQCEHNRTTVQCYIDELIEDVREEEREKIRQEEKLRQIRQTQCQEI